MKHKFASLILTVLLMNHHIVAQDNSGIESLVESDLLNKNEVIAFFGDSITQSGARPGGYCRLIGDAIAKEKEDLKIQVVYAGISGHKVPDLQARLQRDVLSKKPTVVFIYIGINDVWHSQNGRGTPKDKFESGLRELISKITAAGATIVLCTPSTIGEKTDGSNKLDSMLEEYAAISRKVASETDVTLCDLRKSFLDHLKSSNSENKDRGILTTDGVHLNEAGNRFVANQASEFIAAALKQRSKATTNSTTATRSLCNGKDLTGWHADIPQPKDGEAMPASFIVRDGNLVSRGTPRGHLITNDSFKNYRLHVEYRFPGKPGNCGVLVHASTPTSTLQDVPQIN